MSRWFPWSEAPIDPQPGDRLWEIGMPDEVWTGTAWTLLCPTCDTPVVGRYGPVLCCASCGRHFDRVPKRTAPPAAVAQ